jgi:hypothetical protein
VSGRWDRPWRAVGAAEHATQLALAGKVERGFHERLAGLGVTMVHDTIELMSKEEARAVRQAFRDACQDAGLEPPHELVED